MELINKDQQPERLYKINANESYSRNRIINHKVNNAMRFLPEHWRNRNFSMIDNPILKTICEKLEKWDFQNPIISSIISKQNGIGKSFIAICLIRKYFTELITKDFDENFTEWSEERDKYAYLDDGTHTTLEYLKKRVNILNDKKMNLEIQETFSKKNSDRSQLNILDEYCNYRFLVIDDMFSNRTNEFARQNLLYVIDERTEFRNLPTFITSNLTLDEIADIDTRIADRINNSMLFQIDKPIESYRKKL